jgi:hypothetical protein
VAVRILSAAVGRYTVNYVYSRKYSREHVGTWFVWEEHSDY